MSVRVAMSVVAKRLALHCSWMRSSASSLICASPICKPVWICFLDVCVIIIIGLSLPKRMQHGCAAGLVCSADGSGKCVAPPPAPCPTCQVRDTPMQCSFSCKSANGCAEPGCVTQIQCQVGCFALLRSTSTAHATHHEHY